MRESVVSVMGDSTQKQKLLAIITVKVRESKKEEVLSLRVVIGMGTNDRLDDEG